MYEKPECDLNEYEDTATATGRMPTGLGLVLYGVGCRVADSAKYGPETCGPDGGPDQSPQ